MQQLTQLPRADQYLREIAEKTSQHYIETSQKVATQYMKQKSQADSNASMAEDNIQNLRKQLSVMKMMLMTKDHAPETSIDDVRRLVEKYEGLIEEYEQKVSERGEAIRMGSETIGMKESGSEEDMQEGYALGSSQSGIQEEGLMSQGYLSPNFLSSQTKTQRYKTIKRNLLIWGLKSLQFVSVTLMIICVVKLLFFV